MDKESRPRSENHQLGQLEKRYRSWFAAAKLALGSGAGFLDTEITLTLGTYLLYHRFSAPAGAFYSPLFLGLNIFAFVVGVTVAFFITEPLILRDQDHKIKNNFPARLERLGKFQLLFLVGNLVMVAVQMFMLREFGFPPVFGNIVGAIVSFPVSYFSSMHFIWQLKGFDSDAISRNESEDELDEQEERGESAPNLLV